MIDFGNYSANSKYYKYSNISCGKMEDEEGGVAI